MNREALRAFYDRPPAESAADPRWAEAHAALLLGLESGEVRAAEPLGEEWQVNAWVKQGILAAFRATKMVEVPGPGFPFMDKTAFPARVFSLDDAVRMVPGGSSVRRGSFVARGVTLMPPAFINMGAHVDEGAMVDSHALVGSCAQIGKRVHLSAAAQIGGVLEPAGARPVIIEDDVFVGGLVGVFEGVRVRRRAVLASGVILTASTVIHDLVREREWVREVPEDAVVVQGSRPARGEFAQVRGLHLATAVIVKYRDARTDAATALESALRL
ncbi:MAG: 2,3,4,5-tetrahydropyridine-2,6-dicarboxylate N-succinyltransferase [Vicinamibacteria bacterium]|jgi:2,3,4,5-tetrahydropyridine-2-carboxylate N-succinyltransferase|nr:2,3,4,5-tetrahydropyridine-2,6-dicarboxylate N-succinyltransferase [Vicinamibacteria bacterium]